MDQLDEILNEVEHQPTVIDDDEFPDELGKLENEIDDFHDRVKSATGENSIFDVGTTQYNVSYTKCFITQEIINIKEREKDIARTLEEIDENIFTTNDKSKKADHNLDHAEEFLIEVEERLLEVEDNFDLQGKKAFEAAWERYELF